MQNPETAENPYAGQGPVLLDIGGAIGALVVAMPPESEGLEVEIRPAGTTAAAVGHRVQPDDDQDHHEHGNHDHTHDHARDHTRDHGHTTGPTHHPHVGVVARPGPNGPEHCLVYPEVTQGHYELVPMPGDTVVMTAEVEGGVVAYTSWPEDGPGR